MKGGWEQKNKVIGLCVLAALAVLALLYSRSSTSDDAPIALSGGPVNAGTPAAVASTPAATAEGTGGSAATAEPSEAAAPQGSAAGQAPLDPTLHLGVLATLRSIHYGDGGTGRDLFHFVTAPPPPVHAEVGRGALAPKGPVVPAGPPPPPPIPLKFYGYAISDGSTQVFLQDGDAAFIVTEGQLIDKRYLIEKITPQYVMVKDNQTSQEQRLPLLAG